MEIEAEKMNKKIKLKEKDSRAIDEFKAAISKEFPGAEIILFGSKLNGTDDEASDIDVLVILRKGVNTAIEKRVFDIGFEIGLRFEVVFGIVAEERKFWNSKLAKAMPLYQNVAQKGLIM
jgi:predicted nucleotidyltransferase